MNNNLPNFNSIDVKTVPEKLNVILDQNRQTVKTLLKQEHFTWQNLVTPLEEMDMQLHNYWSLVSHMNAVVNSKKLREIYPDCLDKLSDYSTEMSQNEDLYQAIQFVYHDQAKKLDRAQKKVLENHIRDFKLSGVDLPHNEKKRFAEIVKKLSQCHNTFEENVLDATMSWFKQIENEAELKGIPEDVLQIAKQKAKQKELTGYVFTLDIPSYLPVMMYADSRQLREEMYRAYVTRASDIGPDAKKFDNSELMTTILTLRLEAAKLLGFKNYAEESLATKMVKTEEQVLAFLYQLGKAAKPKAKEEFHELAQFAEAELNMPELNPWDLAYASEKLKEKNYSISQQELKLYFPENQVVQGLFAIVNKLFGLTMEEIKNADVWHPDAKCYALKDRKGNLRSYFYFDLYARENKRGGAWMDDCRVRRRLKNGDIQIPMAFVTCNFSGPAENAPALFTHDEVVTLFHEFGHALQHMLTTMDYADVSGINGIPWDAVEVASQFLENWAWQAESILFFAKHYQTGEPLPKEMLDKMQRAKNFQAAMQMMRQVEFSLFDFKLHVEFDPTKQNQIQTILNEVRDAFSVVPVSPFNRFQHGFSHIFAGGYAAGYYSYKWAEVMASDAFSLFLEKGIFDSKAAESFCACILEPGGSEEPADLFKRFRGRDPEVNALLKQDGII